MTRKEEILKASKIYSEYKYNQTDFENGFINGAKWADNNPTKDIINLNDVWHDASEEPQESMNILCLSKKGSINLVSNLNEWLYNWLKNESNLDKWAYISDLLPKQFGNSEQLKGGKK